MCHGVDLCPDKARNELQRSLDKDLSIGRADDLVFEIHIHSL